MSCVSAYAGVTPALQKHHIYLEFRLVCGLHRITIVLFILCSVINASLSDRFKVSSKEEVSVTVGSDVVLHCLLTPEMNAENMEIRWFKNTFHPYVVLCINGKDDHTDQMLEFKKRTELIKENITRGVFPLKIHKVTAQDSGIYNCFAESSDHHESSAVHLLIETETIENGPLETSKVLLLSIIPVIIVIIVIILVLILIKFVNRKNARIPQSAELVNAPLNEI